MTLSFVNVQLTDKIQKYVHHHYIEAQMTLLVLPSVPGPTVACHRQSLVVAQVVGQVDIDLTLKQAAACIVLHATMDVVKVTLDGDDGECLIPSLACLNDAIAANRPPEMMRNYQGSPPCGDDAIVAVFLRSCGLIRVAWKFDDAIVAAG